MRALVTGYGGFSGTHLAHALADFGWDVTAHCRVPRAHDPRLRVLTGDLGGLRGIPDDLDLLVHAAATSPAAGVTSQRMIADNVLGTQTLIELALTHKASRIMFFSSLSVYGDLVVRDVDESAVLRAPDVYGLTKLLGERFLAEVADRLPSLSIRLPAVVGPGAARHWLASLVEKARAGREIEVFNPDAPFNNVVHIESLASLAREVAGRDWAGAEIVTVGSVKPMPIREVALLVAGAFGGRSEVRIIDRNRLSFVVSSRKAIDRFGFQPLTTRSAIMRYLQQAQA